MGQVLVPGGQHPRHEAVVGRPPDDQSQSVSSTTGGLRGAGRAVPPPGRRDVPDVLVDLVETARSTAPSPTGSGPATSASATSTGAARRRSPGRGHGQHAGAGVEAEHAPAWARPPGQLAGEQAGPAAPVEGPLAGRGARAAMTSRRCSTTSGCRRRARPPGRPPRRTRACRSRGVPRPHGGFGEQLSGAHARADDPGLVEEVAATSGGRTSRREELLAALRHPAAEDDQVGQMSWSMRSRYSFSSGAHCAQESPCGRGRRPTRRSASLPRISMWPSSRLGTSAPSTNSAARSPCRGSASAPRPRPCRRRTASRRVGGVGVVEDDDQAGPPPVKASTAFTPIQLLWMLAAAMAVPPIRLGRPTPTGPSSGPSSAMSAAVRDDRLQLGGLGRGHPYPLALEDAAARVHDRALDPAAADIDPDEPSHAASLS